MKLAAVFPGQGSQSPGMLADLAAQYKVVGETFAEASEHLGYDLWDVAQNGSAEQQRQTEITQPLMFVGGMAVWRIWQQLKMPAPSYVAGHSLGEYTAMTAAGAIDFVAATKLVALRGKLMAGAVEPGVGGMAALLGMDDDAVVAMCNELTTEDGVVQAVNFNSPGQVVISGHLKALEHACVVAKDKGARKAMVLPVSVPNHSSLMQPAQAELAAAIDSAGFVQPKIPVVQNAEAKVLDSLDALRASLRNHVINPVYWTDSIRYMAKNGVTELVEIGPGKVLAGLCKRIDKSITTHAIESLAAVEKLIEARKEGVADA